MKEKKGERIGDSTQKNGIPEENHWERKIKNSEKNYFGGMDAFCPQSGEDRPKLYKKVNQTDH